MGIKLKSMFLLGTGFLAHVASRMTFTYDPGGIKRFRQNFDSDGLIPMTERDRELHASWTRCTACGLCDLVCPDLLAPIPRGRFTGPRMVASGILRDLPNFSVTCGDAHKLMACDTCRECEAICPVELPLRELAEFIVRIGDEGASGKPLSE